MSILKKLRWFILTNFVDPYLRAKRGFGYTDLFDFDHYVLELIYKALFGEGQLYNIQKNSYKLFSEYDVKMNKLKQLLEDYLTKDYIEGPDASEVVELMKDLIDKWWL